MTTLLRKQLNDHMITTGTFPKDPNGLYKRCSRISWVLPFISGQTHQRADPSLLDLPDQGT